MCLAFFRILDTGFWRNGPIRSRLSSTWQPSRYKNTSSVRDTGTQSMQLHEGIYFIYMYTSYTQLTSWYISGTDPIWLTQCDTFQKLDGFPSPHVFTGKIGQVGPGYNVNIISRGTILTLPNSSWIWYIPESRQMLTVKFTLLLFSIYIYRCMCYSFRSGTHST